MMKSLLLIAVATYSFVCSAQTSPRVTTGPNVSVVGQSYTVSARYSQPLDTNQRCEGPSPSYYNIDLGLRHGLYDGTYAGYKAYEIAALEGMAACESDYNADCRVIAAYYQDIMSVEFPGFKACEATLIIHGYRLN